MKYHKIPEDHYETDWKRCRTFMRPLDNWGSRYCFAKWEPNNWKMMFVKQLMNVDLRYSVPWHWNALVDTKTDDLDFDDGEYSDQDEEEGATEPHQPHQQEQAVEVQKGYQYNRNTKTVYMIPMKTQAQKTKFSDKSTKICKDFAKPSEPPLRSITKIANKKQT